VQSESEGTKSNDCPDFWLKAISLFNNRIASLTPNPLVIIHHQVNNDGHHLPHDFSTLGYLAAVDVVVPDGAAV